MGATAGSKGMGVFAQYHQRKETREINKTDDIFGAQTGSLKKAPQTKRHLNPLDPQYSMPGDKELLDTKNVFS